MTALLAGRPAANQFATGHNHDINVTPFVDVMLVLLIVFIIAAPLATNTLKLDLPRGGVGHAPPPKLAIVSIDAAGSIYVSSGSLTDAPTDLEPAGSGAAAGRRLDTRLGAGRPAGAIRPLRAGAEPPAG